MDLTHRPRRLRRDGIRELVSETTLQETDLIAPVFVDATADSPTAIDSLPGHDRLPIDDVVARVEDILATGIEAIILFGIPETKDARGSRAWAEDGVIQEATRRIKRSTEAVVITDLCFCEYTTHGHCGILESEVSDEGNSNAELTVDNDATLRSIERTAISQARAGADIIAPSGMIDGQIATIRTSLDEGGFQDRGILSYAAKYNSGFYGPFRDAADGAPSFGDRRHYQMDPANAREANREIELDIQQGADILMVKPALAYLDILSAVRVQSELPVAAYNVSGEYAMIHAAAANGWLDLDRTARESLLSIKRAGADLIITYFAESVAADL